MRVLAASWHSLPRVTLYKVNKIRTTTILLVVLALAVCVTNAQGASKVSSRKAKSFIKQLEKEHQVAYQQVKKQFAERSYIWVQAENKDVECKLLFGGNESEALKSKFYWDGECKDGYASGLGREFLDSTSGLSSWLGEYGGPGKRPLYYYTHFYDAKVTIVGFDNSAEVNPLGSNGSVYQFSDNISNLNFSVRQNYFDPETGYIFGQTSNSASDIVNRAKVFSNGKGFMIKTFLDPNEPTSRWAYFIDEKGAPFGYGIAVGRNGQVVHSEYKNGIRSTVELPRELVEHFNSLEREINAKLNLARSNYQRGELALEVYTRRTCSGELNVDFMDNFLYGQICLEHGDFTPYIDKIEELQVNAQKRQETNAQTALRQKEIDANNRVAATQQQRAQQQARQAQQAQEYQMLRDSSNSLQQTRNATNQIINNTYSRMNNYSLPALGSWAGSSSSQRNVSVCHVMGNIVTCN